MGTKDENWCGPVMYLSSNMYFCVTTGAEENRRQGRLHNLPATSLSPETTTEPFS